MKLSIVASIWLFSGRIVFFLGVQGIYIAKIFSEVKRRPYTIVRQVFAHPNRPAHAKIEAVGFDITRSTSFVSALLPAMVASRWFQGKAPAEAFDATTEFRISPWLNALLYWLSLVEIALIKLGIDFPLGGPRLIVARKK